MTANEIRAQLDATVTLAKGITDPQGYANVCQALQVQMVVEIAAQLAELNVHLKAIHAELGLRR